VQASFEFKNIEELLMKQNSDDFNPYILFLTGASGAGKTTMIEALNAKLNNSSIVCLHFDSIGVPSEEEMIKKYGSPSEWQKAMTYHWIKKLTSEYKHRDLVIIEGQVNLSFIVTAFDQLNYDKYKIILAHCDNTSRHQRLHIDRNQPELINENMDNWSEFLKNQAIEMNVTILDTTSMTKHNMLSWLLEYIRKLGS
jgi:dephospho-CoA kinase